jgi:hypothetical protein
VVGSLSMAVEYVVAGRRKIPGMLRVRAWSWTFEIDDSYDEDEDDVDDEAAYFEEGSLAIDEIRRSGNEEFYAFVTKHAGFVPKSVLTVRKAGWEFSRAAAEVLAAALDGVYFVDAAVEEHGLEPPVASIEAAKSVGELQARIEAASRQAAVFFERWAAQDAAARAEHDRLHPEDAALRERENDWSDVSDG